MLYIIVTGGPLPSEAADLIRRLSDPNEDTVIIGCDGGCDFLARYGIVPDLVVGDMDSITGEGLEFINSHNVYIEKYPVEKDWTDTEIALSKTFDDDVYLVAPCSGRLDHVIANLQLSLKLREEGRKITVSDGRTYCYPLAGEDSVEIDVSTFDGPVSVSLVPWDFSQPVKGVTTRGLYYPLEEADLPAGPTFSLSNHPTDKNGRISISIKAGLLLVTATFAN